MKLAWLSFGIFNRHRQQQHGITSGLQAVQPVYSHTEMGNNNSVGNNLAAHYAEASGLQRHIAYPVSQALGNNPIQKYEGGIAASNSGGLSLNSGDYLSRYSHGLNSISHRHTLPLKTRFGRAYRAFVNAWRAA